MLLKPPSTLTPEHEVLKPSLRARSETDGIPGNMYSNYSIWARLIVLGIVPWVIVLRKTIAEFNTTVSLCMHFNSYT